MKHIGIVGSRRRDGEKDKAILLKRFSLIYQIGDVIVSGHCPRGADRFAEEIAEGSRIPIILFPPDWKRYGKGAGHIRNTDIAKLADILIACVALDRTGGTEDTIKKFIKYHPDREIILV